MPAALGYFVCIFSMTNYTQTRNNSFIKENTHVTVEYCGVCDYGGHCLELAKIIQSTTPEATVQCNRGRQGSFEITVNNTLIYSKLQTMALPDYEEVVEVIDKVALGEEPRLIKKQQPINCVIT